MARIIDLDDLAPDDLTVRKGQQDYLLPGDPPLAMWLRVADAGDAFMASEGEDQRVALDGLSGRMLELFQIRQPDMTELPFGTFGMFRLLAGIYGTDPEPDPPKPRRNGGGASTTKTKRSSASSAAKPKTAKRSRSSS